MELEFYDVKTKSKFKTSEFDVRKKVSKGIDRYFAVAKSQSGTHDTFGDFFSYIKFRSFKFTLSFYVVKFKFHDSSLKKN
jgi:hypothetical protein